MRLPLNWLKEFVDIPVTPEELADRLTLVGFEVEGIDKLFPDFSGVVVGRAVRVDPHPNADRLTVVEVEDGRRTYQVVCGAPDVTAGRIYAFAPPGATISQGRELKAVKLRGIVSEGMLLAEDELGVSSDHATLMAIPQDLTLGRDLGEALQFADVVLEVGVTPNRPDCLSILGLAREVAAIFRQPLRHPEIDFPEADEDIAQFAKVTILDAVACPRYAARLLTGLQVGPSPFWMRHRLKLAGLRPSTIWWMSPTTCSGSWASPSMPLILSACAGVRSWCACPRPERKSLSPWTPRNARWPPRPCISAMGSGPWPWPALWAARNLR